MSKKALVPVNVLSSRATPTGRYSGDVYFNADSQSLFVYNGTTWTEFIPTVATEDGGAPNTTTWNVTADNGTPYANFFDYTYDGGILA